jgi:hypothetical protein
MNNDPVNAPNEMASQPEMRKFWDKEKQQDLYRVNDTPAHSHTGSDSPRIDFGDITGRLFYVTYTIPGTSAQTATNYSTFFTALVPCVLLQVSEVHAVKGTVAPSCKVEKLVSGTAPGAGILLNNASFDLTSTNNTPVIAKLSDGSLKGSFSTVGIDTVRDVNLAVGDSLAVRVTGTLTSLQNVVFTCQLLLQ